MLQAARELIFRFAAEQAMGVAEEYRPVQRLMATHMALEIIYQTGVRLVWASPAIVIATTIAVAPLLLHWWRLGIAASMSPIEIVRAFGAPKLNNAGSTWMPSG